MHNLYCGKSGQKIWTTSVISKKQNSPKKTNSQGAKICPIWSPCSDTIVQKMQVLQFPVEFPAESQVSVPYNRIQAVLRCTVCDKTPKMKPNPFFVKINA
jgi:hypothetical protein